MTDWTAIITKAVADAASKAELRTSPGAFDGSGWIWLWRPDSRHGAGHRVSEARIRVQPDSLNEGLEIEVSAAAWLEDRRNIAASRTIAAEFVTYRNLEKDAGELTSRLAHHLSDAWRTAFHLAERLPDVQNARGRVAEVIQNFRQRPSVDG